MEYHGLTDTYHDDDVSRVKSVTIAMETFCGKSMSRGAINQPPTLLGLPVPLVQNSLIAAFILKNTVGIIIRKTYRIILEDCNS